MHVRAGTSGFSYQHWRGGFYPQRLAPAEMLSVYARQLSTVEINSTFYQMPKPDVVAGWYDQTPHDFQFVLKGSRRITHQQRLAGSRDSVAYLFKVAAILQHKLGVVFFQLPPNLRRDGPLLEDFLAALPGDCRVALEFRHGSWREDGILQTLHERGAAVCFGDEHQLWRAIDPTTTWGYVRLREESYSDRELDHWVDEVARQPWKEAFVFFKHEVRGPELAQRFNQRAAEAAGRLKPPIKTRSVGEVAAKQGAG